MIDTFVKDGKTYTKLKNLHLWEKNPRGCREEDFNRLKRQIQKLKQYKPMVVNSGKYWGDAGTVAGGNMRFRAFEKLGIEDVWISLIDPKSEGEMIEYALSDNDRAGYYEDEALVELLSKVPDINLDDFKVDLGNPLPVSVLVGRFGPEQDPEEIWKGMPEFKEIPDFQAYKTLFIHFKTEEDYRKFGEFIKQKLTKKTKYVWWPKRKKRDLESLRYASGKK